MMKSKEMLLDLVIWSEKNAIDLEKWIMSIRLEKHIAKRLEKASNSRPAAVLDSIDKLTPSVIAPNHFPHVVCQVG